MPRIRLATASLMLVLVGTSTANATAATQLQYAPHCTPEAIGGAAGMVIGDAVAVYSNNPYWLCPLFDDSAVVTDRQLTGLEVDVYNYVSASESAEVCLVNSDESGGACSFPATQTGAGALQLDLTPSLSLFSSDTSGTEYSYVFVTVDTSSGDLVGIYATH